MSYRNKTYVVFASEDIHCYRLMGRFGFQRGVIVASRAHLGFPA
jgi:hypothetical protein